MVNDPIALIQLLGLRPLPREGGLWSQVLIDDQSTAIYYLLTAGDFSALHRLPGPEIYHHYMGAALQMLQLHPDATVTTPIVGTDLESGERPALVVPGGVWQASRSLGDWTLVGTTTSPPFSIAEFELGDREHLIGMYPDADSLITAHTR